MTRKLLALGGLILMLLTLTPAIPVMADSITLSVAPSRIELTATPGGRGSQELTAYNEGTQPFGIHAGVETYKDGTGDRSAVAWLTVSPADFTLEPGQQRAVTVSIAVPSEINSGGRYAAVVFQTQAMAVSGTGTGVSGKLGVPFMIAVEGEGTLSRTARLVSLLPVLKPGRGSQMVFQTTLKNTGNLHLFPKGQVEVTQADSGDAVGTSVLPAITAVLPGSTALLATRAALPVVAGQAYRARATVDYGGEVPASFDTDFVAHVELAITQLTADVASDGVTLRAGLHNAGTLGLQPHVRFTIRNARDTSGTIVGTIMAPQTTLLQPDQTITATARYAGQLAAGEYALVTLVDAGTDTPLTKVVVFQVEQAIVPAKANAGWKTVSPTSERQTRFPWVPVAGGIIVIMLCVLLVAFLPALAMLRARLKRMARAWHEQDEGD